MDEDWRNTFGIFMCTEICDGPGAEICDGSPSTCSSFLSFLQFRYQNVLPCIITEIACNPSSFSQLGKNITSAFCGQSFFRKLGLRRLFSNSVNITIKFFFRRKKEKASIIDPNITTGALVGLDQNILVFVFLISPPKHTYLSTPPTGPGEY